MMPAAGRATPCRDVRERHTAQSERASSITAQGQPAPNGSALTWAAIPSDVEPSATASSTGSEPHRTLWPVVSSNNGDNAGLPRRVPPAGGRYRTPARTVRCGPRPTLACFGSSPERSSYPLDVVTTTTPNDLCRVGARSARRCKLSGRRRPLARDIAAAAIEDAAARGVRRLLSSDTRRCVLSASGRVPRGSAQQRRGWWPVAFRSSVDQRMRQGLVLRVPSRRSLAR